MNHLQDFSGINRVARRNVFENILSADEGQFLVLSDVPKNFRFPPVPNFRRLDTAKFTLRLMDEYLGSENLILLGFCER